MRLEFDITYLDGTTEHVKVRPIHLVQMEDRGIVIGDSAKSSFQIAHAATGREDSFEDWLAVVEDIDTVTDEITESGPRPTQEPSQTSPS